MPDRDLDPTPAPAPATRPLGNPGSSPPAAPAHPGVPAAAPPITGMVTFLSSRRRDGTWTVPPHLRVASLLGTVELDLRQAIIDPAGSVIEVLTLFGSVDIVVPPGVNVDCDGDAVIGSFELRVDHGAMSAGAPPPGAPRVRVTGRAYMGSISVRVKGPDQPLGARIRASLGLGA